MNTALKMRDAYVDWRDDNPITKYLLRHDMSRNEFAAQARVSARTVQAWQWGTSAPADERIQDLATLLGVAADTFRLMWRNWETRRPGENKPTKP